MQVNDIQLRQLPNGQELSARIDGQSIWYRFPPDCAVSTRGDAFVAAALLPAMVKGESLVIDQNAPVSPRLLQHVSQLQDIFHCWNPAFHRISIEASQEPAATGRTGAISFFSGGVDSIYTFLQHVNEITDLVFIRGFDIALDNVVLSDAAALHNQTFATAFGKTLLVVDTNIRSLCYPNSPLPLAIYYGPMMATIGLALSFPATFLAAGLPYSAMMPDGSHALTDPLWSNEATSFRHDGADASRSEKLRVIAADPVAKEVLRVCWSNPSEGYNCGTCGKCLRTLISLRLLGIDLPTFPRLESLQPVRRLRVEHEVDMTYFQDNLDLARRVGDKEMWNALRSCILKYRTRKLLAHVDRLALNGQFRNMLTNMRRKMNPNANTLPKLSLH